MPARALVVEDHPIVSDVVAASLTSLKVFQEIVTTASLKETHSLLKRDANFTLIMLDLGLSDTDGLESMTELREQYPDIPLVIFSGQDSTETIIKAFECGVRGFIPKSSPMSVIVSALKVVLAGSSYIPPDAIRGLGIVTAAGTEVPEAMHDEQVTLSPKQRDVFEELLKGVPNKIIAQRLNMAEGTVKTHLHSIYQILKVRSRAQAILKAQDIGIF